MLLKLSDEIRECHAHALQAGLKAKTTNDPIERQEFLDMERRWLGLARSYELSEQISRLTLNYPRDVKVER